MMTCCSRSSWPWSSHKWLQNCLHVGFNQSKCDSYQNKCKAIAEGIMNVNDNCFFPVVRSIVHNLLINRKLCMHIWQLATQKCTICAELFKRIGFRQQLWQDSGRRIVCLWKGWQGRFFLIAKSCCCTTICFFCLCRSWWCGNSWYVNVCAFAYDANVVKNFINVGFWIPPHSSIITLFSWVIRLGGAKNMSSKVLELYLMDACLSKFNLNVKHYQSFYSNNNT